jgi:hypothetical protein
MKTLLLIILCAGIQLQAQSMKTDEVTFSDSTGFFTINFVYNEARCTIPLTYPAGCPHYDAEVTVNQIIDGKPILLGKPFPWTYTKQKCYEGNPATLVRYAKVLNDPYYHNRLEKEEGYPDDLWGYINEGTPLLPADTTDFRSLTDTTTTNWNNFEKDSATRAYLGTPLKIAEILPTSLITISGKNTSLHLDFKGDSLVVSGDMSLTEGAQKFVDFCRLYMKTKMDSLETELEKCKKQNNTTMVDTVKDYKFGYPLPPKEKLHIVPSGDTLIGEIQKGGMRFGDLYPTDSLILGQTYYLTDTTFRNPFLISNGSLDSTWSEPVKYDTTAVIMQVCDTSTTKTKTYLGLQNGIPTFKYSWELNGTGSMFWIRGYQVTKKVYVWDSWYYNQDTRQSEQNYFTETVCYLDSDKKRINYLVWMAKEVKQP